MSNALDNLIGQWTKLGAGFNTIPSAGTPDLERLLLDTARHASQMSRLFIMAATWLHRYGDLIAKHRLNRLICDELAVEHRPILGLLLDIAQQGTHPLQFPLITRTLAPALEPRPLFDAEAAHPALAERSRRRASDISRRWNLWCSPIEFKDDAIRPARWVMAQNRDFVIRADFRGDLRSSILASLRFDANAGESESKLARSSGGSRTQVRESLSNLELTGRIARVATPSARRTQIALLWEA